MLEREQKFNFNIPLEILGKGDAEGEWRIGGIASTEDKDFQGEIVKIDGLDISTLSKNGFFNEDHKKGFEHILGKVQFAEKRDDPDKGKHLYVEGKLFKTQPAAIAAWNIMRELGEETDKKMQLSVEGKILKRAGKDNKVVTKAKVENVALTLNPINENTFATFLKSVEGVESEREMEKSKSDLKDKAISFLKENNNPTDKQVKEYSDSENIDYELFEEAIFSIATDYIKERDTLMKKASYDSVFVTLNKSTQSKLLKYIDSKKSFRDLIYDLVKGVTEDQRRKIFDTLIKAKEELAKKALEVSHSYATQLPQERTGGDAMMTESIDRVTNKKKKIKKIVEKALKLKPELKPGEAFNLVKKSLEKRAL